MSFYYQVDEGKYLLGGDHPFIPLVAQSLHEDFGRCVELDALSVGHTYFFKPYQLEALKASAGFRLGIAKSIAAELIEENRTFAKLQKTLILTSEDNFVWQSMQEIIPSLEELWASTASPEHEVYYFNVDKDQLKDKLPLFLGVQNVFVTCFNLKIARTVELLRERIGIDARFFIELHNMATIACWPFHEWGMGKSFKTSDVFISTCQYDLETLKLVYPEAQQALIPFHATKLDSVEKKSVFKGKAIFAYVGRISVQKNLHTLLAALSLLKNQDFECHFYGGEDHLGSPNMEMYPEAYLDYLKKLTKKLHLEDKVFFKGHYPREKLYEELHDPRVVLVSPSLHSDENFGMALFRGLITGQRVVCSDWGGHKDFAGNFPKQVKLVSVYQTHKGPQVHAGELAQALVDVLKLSPQEGHLPSVYSLPVLRQLIQDLLNSQVEQTQLVQRSLVAEQVHQRRSDYLAFRKEKSSEARNNLGCKIFSSYEDELAHVFFRAYGMKQSRKKSDLYVLLPWVEKRGEIIVSQDIHRAESAYCNSHQTENYVFTWWGEKVSLDAENFSKLWNNGDLISLAHGTLWSVKEVS